MRRQSFDDPAISNGAAAALIDHAVQLAAQRAQVGDLSIDFNSMLSGNGIDGFTRSVALVGQIEQCADLVERKAKVARAPDEA
ncbi:hypothetical protein HYPGJ_10256 [Hyphomicrobium sp. GJ21]|nr:hypothetical protein HYPGJ_10256 [Hyphomicrobium sp. GJ21]